MKSRNQVILRPMYVFHNLLELAEASVLCRTAENVSDKMAVVFLT